MNARKILRSKLLGYLIISLTIAISVTPMPHERPCAQAAQLAAGVLVVVIGGIAFFEYKHLKISQKLMPPPAVKFWPNTLTTDSSIPELCGTWQKIENLKYPGGGGYYVNTVSGYGLSPGQVATQTQSDGSVHGVYAWIFTDKPGGGTTVFAQGPTIGIDQCGSPDLTCFNSPGTPLYPPGITNAFPLVSPPCVHYQTPEPDIESQLVSFMATSGTGNTLLSSGIVMAMAQSQPVSFRLQDLQFLDDEANQYAPGIPIAPSSPGSTVMQGIDGVQPYIYPVGNSIYVNYAQNAVDGDATYNRVPPYYPWTQILQTNGNVTVGSSATDGSLYSEWMQQPDMTDPGTTRTAMVSSDSNNPIPAGTYQLQRSTNLKTWTPVMSGTITIAAPMVVVLVDDNAPPASPNSSLFYRLCMLNK